MRSQLYSLWVLLALLFLAACGGSETQAPPTLDPQSPEGQGEAVFRTHCAACHAIAGDRVVVGPSLAGIGTRAATRVAGDSAEDYLYDSIMEPDKLIVEGFAAGAMQQNFASTLTSEEIDHVIAYLLTLK